VPIAVELKLKLISQEKHFLAFDGDEPAKMSLGVM
jgi:hypothetical protein